jgi:hypothetical protein
MALTTEQQQQIELAVAQAQAVQATASQAEAERRAHEIEMETRRTRLELLRTAKDALTENRKNLPVSERQITEADIINFADALHEFIAR